MDRERRERTEPEDHQIQIDRELVRIEDRDEGHRRESADQCRPKQLEHERRAGAGTSVIGREMAAALGAG